MITLASSIHDPKAGMKWMSDKYLEELIDLFDDIFLTSSPFTDSDYLTDLDSKNINLNKREDNKIGRNYFDSIKRAYNDEIDYIFYCDFDRILHWIKEHPEELEEIIHFLRKQKKDQGVDYIVAQRTEAGYKEHQDSLYLTEQLPNKIISDKMELNSQKDFLAGCFIFSKKASKLIIDDGGYDNLSFFGAWPILLKDKVEVEYKQFEGLGWETADWHREEVEAAGSRSEFREMLNNKEEWRKRVKMANEFVEKIL